MDEMTKCKNCGNYCPSGTLDSGLCTDCDMIGKEIRVAWGRFGLWLCKVTGVSKNGTIYAARWNRKRQEWTSPRPIEFYQGVWYRS